MENQLEIIKSNLPYGYEGSIAKEAGCSKGTVHNILNNKPASARSSYKAKVLTIATRYNPQIEMFARFKMKSSFHKTKRII